MLIHRGEAWLDAGHACLHDAPPDKGGVTGLAVNVHFDEKVDTRPEEVLATAHAASFCLSLWSRLQKAGHPPRSVHAVTFVHHPSSAPRQSEAEIFINADADIPGVTEEAFAEHAKAAKGDFVALRGLSGIPVRLEPRLLQ